MYASENHQHAVHQIPLNRKLYPVTVELTRPKTQNPGWQKVRYSKLHTLTNCQMTVMSIFKIDMKRCQCVKNEMEERKKKISVTLPQTIQYCGSSAHSLY